jgi:hypothetical protein
LGTETPLLKGRCWYIEWRRSAPPAPGSLATLGSGLQNLNIVDQEVCWENLSKIHYSF